MLNRLIFNNKEKVVKKRSLKRILAFNIIAIFALGNKALN